MPTYSPDGNDDGVDADSDNRLRYQAMMHGDDETEIYHMRNKILISGCVIR